MATTFDVIYLGTAASLDPFEGDKQSENASSIVGNTYGSSGSPLHEQVQTFSANSFSGGVGGVYDTDNTSSNDTFRIDGGPLQTHDSTVVYNATITYVDGSTVSMGVVVFQDTSGNLYLAPSYAPGFVDDAYEAKPIESLTLDSVASDTNDLGADREFADFMEVVDGTAGDDSGGPGATDADGDQIDGTDGDAEYIKGYGGNDTVNAGAGDDFLEGGTGDDSLTGGAGDDTFVYNPGDGADVITDFNTGNTGTISDGDSTNNDFIDLSGYYDSIFELYADRADDGVLNQSNDGVDANYSDNTQFQPGDSLTFTGASADSSFFTVENTGVACYARGTRILTPWGEVPIESLKPGDEVITRDHGAQVVRWIGTSTVARTPALAPIRIRAGALGSGRPARDLWVSPQHRMLIRSRIVERMTGGKEVLVAATKLTGMPGIRSDARPGPVRYLHLLCDAHEIVFAEGVPSETLLPGQQAREAMGAEAWAELNAIFPDIDDTLRRFPSARPIPSGPQQKHLVRRHRRNRVPLLETM